MNLSAEIALQLLQIKAIKLSPQDPFTWASGIQSPIYCDNRMVLSYPTVRNTVKSALAKKASEFEDFEVVAGVATAGIAHGVLLADALGVPFIYIRNKAKSHGRQNLIEGELKAGKKVLVVEDLLSTGGSALKAVEAIRASDCEVVGVLAIFSYGLNQLIEAFQQQNCIYKTLSSYEILIEQAVKNNYINLEEAKILKTWRKKPSSWQVTNS